MKIDGLGSTNNYYDTRLWAVRNRARTTDSIEEQIRIAKNTEERTVLLSLTLNRTLSEEAVQELFDRDLPDITKRLKDLGFKK